MGKNKTIIRKTVKTLSSIACVICLTFSVACATGSGSSTIGAPGQNNLSTQGSVTGQVKGLSENVKIQVQHSNQHAPLIVDDPTLSYVH